MKLGDTPFTEWAALKEKVLALAVLAIGPKVDSRNQEMWDTVYETAKLIINTPIPELEE